MDKAELTNMGWLGLGYAIILVAIQLQNPWLFFVGMPAIIFGMISQMWIAQVVASKFTFIKAPIRTFYQQNSIVEQFKYKDGPKTYYSAHRCDADGCKKNVAYLRHLSEFPAHRNFMTPLGANLSIFPLESPWHHPKYKRQKVLCVEHDGEYTDHVRHESGEITYLNVSGIPHNKVDICEFWETPRTHPIGLRIHPIFVFSKGGGAKDYDRWIRDEIQKVDIEQRRELLQMAIIP